MSGVLQRTCPWCEAPSFDGAEVRCGSCAGPLPAFPAEVLRARPELLQADEVFAAIAPGPPPRTLPGSFARRVMLGDGQFVLGWVWMAITALLWLAGLVAMCLFVPVGLVLVAIAAGFTWIGVSVLWRAWRRIAAGLGALRRGLALEAVVLDAQIGAVTSIRYRFSLDGRPVERTETSHRAVYARLDAGDRVWVVCEAHRPEQSRLWPPV